MTAPSYPLACGLHAQEGRLASRPEAVPPRLSDYTKGGSPNLGDALVDLGHDVLPFARAAGRMGAIFVPAGDQAIRLTPGGPALPVPATTS
jgi:hypothetical protein